MVLCNRYNLMLSRLLLFIVKICRKLSKLWRVWSCGIFASIIEKRRENQYCDFKIEIRETILTFCSVQFVPGINELQWNSISFFIPLYCKFALFSRCWLCLFSSQYNKEWWQAQPRILFCRNEFNFKTGGNPQT